MEKQETFDIVNAKKQMTNKSKVTCILKCCIFYKKCDHFDYKNNSLNIQLKI